MGNLGLGVDRIRIVGTWLSNAALRYIGEAHIMD